MVDLCGMECESTCFSVAVAVSACLPGDVEKDLFLE